MAETGKRLRVVFMGTPSFAVPSLERLLDAGDLEVVGVVTQPDARSGRGQTVAMSPVKRVALTHGLPVLQPERVRRPEAVAALRALAPDLQIVAAFGQILPRAVLDNAPLGTLNVHASLLPRWRGAAPVAAAILAGDDRSGVTIMLVDEGMDSGDILAQATVDILPDDTTGSLTQRLAVIGADLLLATLARWLGGDIAPQKQDEGRVTICRPIPKESGQVDWTQPALAIERAVRAYAPWPGAYTTWNGKLIKILAARALAGTAGKAPGTAMVGRDGLLVATGDGFLLLREVQLEGRRAMPARDFVLGQRGIDGAQLGAL